MSSGDVDLPTVTRTFERSYRILTETSILPIAAVEVPTLVRTDRTLTRPSDVSRQPVYGFWLDFVQLAINGLAIFLTVTSLCLIGLSTLPTLLGYRSVVVGSGSMQPSLEVADVVVTRSPVHPLGVGAVIDHEVEGRNRVHRVIQVDGAFYVTKGDNNQSADASPVPRSAVNGVGVMVVPMAGLPTYLADQGHWIRLLSLAVLLVLSTLFSGTWWTTWSRRDSLAAELVGRFRR